MAFQPPPPFLHASMADAEADDYDSEEEAERMRDMEAHLYSMVHYADNVEDVTQKVDFNSSRREVLPAPLNEEDEDEIQILHTTKTPSCSDSGFNTSVAPSPNDHHEVIELNCTQSTISSDSDDDGIQVLSTPAVMKKPRGFQESTIVILSSSEESSSDEEEEEPVIKMSKVFPEVQIISTSTPKDRVPIINTPSVNPHSGPKARLIVEEPSANSTPAPKKYVALLSSDSESSSDSDSSILSSDDLLTASINLHVTGERHAGARYKTFREIVGDDVEIPEEEQIQYPKWTNEMKEFYNEITPDKVDVTMEQVLQGMGSDPDDWRVPMKDRIGTDGGSNRRGSGRYFTGGGFNQRCHNCCEFGHIKSDCPAPIKPIICCICAEHGHTYHSCPNTTCVNCHQPGPMYDEYCSGCRRASGLTCAVCGSQGHEASTCADNWRRYHVTTSEAEIVKPEVDPHRPVRDMICVNCGRQGHHAFQCTMYRNVKLVRWPARSVVFSYDEPEKMSPKQLSRRQQKKETKEVKKRFKAGANGRNNLGAYAKPFMQGTPEAPSDDLDDDLLLAGGSTFKNKRKQQRMRKKNFKCEEEEASMIRQQSLTLDKIKFKQRGFISRVEGGGKHTRFGNETRGKKRKSGEAFNESFSGKKYDQKKKSTKRSSDHFNSKSPGRSDNFNGKSPRRSSDQFNEKSPRRSSDQFNSKKSPKPGKSPGDCPKSMQKVCSRLKKEMKRCKLTPKAKGARSRASEELHFLRDMNITSVPKKDRKRLTGLLNEFQRY